MKLARIAREQAGWARSSQEKEREATAKLIREDLRSKTTVELETFCLLAEFVGGKQLRASAIFPKALPVPDGLIYCLEFQTRNGLKKKELEPRPHATVYQPYCM